MSHSNEYITLLNYLQQNSSCKKDEKVIVLKSEKKIKTHETGSTNLKETVKTKTNLKDKVNKLSKVLAENFDDNIWKI
jgi:hypothetical protein